MLKGKNIVMGVTGGIAAWKACLILNKLVIDLHANVDVIMTKNSETFITEQTIRTLSRNIVTRDMFKEPAVWSVEHISLARKADCFLIAPCTANVIGKIANGIADDMLTTTVMATHAPVVIAPAMNPLSRVICRSSRIWASISSLSPMRACWLTAARAPASWLPLTRSAIILST